MNETEWADLREEMEWALAFDQDGTPSKQDKVLLAALREIAALRQALGVYADIDNWGNLDTDTARRALGLPLAGLR